MRKAREQNKYRVTTQEKLILRGRVTADTVDHYFTVYAYSSLQARIAVRNAGHKYIVKVEKIS